MPACAGAAAAGCVRRADQESVSARDRGQCRLEIDPPGRRGGSRRRAVVSDAAGIQRVPGVRMESLRADSVFSRGYPETTCARGGALQGRCERVFRAGRAGCRPALALQPPGACSRADQESVSARDRGQCRLEIDPPGRRGGSRRRAVVSDAAGIQRVPGVGTESLRADSAFSRRVSRTTCARGGALQGRCVFRAGTGRMPACAGAAAAGCVQPSRSGVRVCAGPRAVPLGN